MGASKNRTAAPVEQKPDIPAEYMTDEIRALTLKISEDLPSISISNDKEYSRVTEAWLGEKELLKTIELSFEGTETVPGPKALAHQAHKSICTLQAKLTKPVLERIEIYGTAIAAYDDVKEAAALATSRANTLEAVAEDQNRREAEAAFLDQRAESEGRPDLAERADAVRTEVRPLPAAAPVKSTPATPGMSFTVKHEPECDNLESFVLAVARPKLLRLMAMTVRKSLDAGKLSNVRKEERLLLVNVLEQAAGDAIAIPMEALDVNLSFVKKYANASDAATKAVAQWPGISLTREKAPRKVGRR